MAKGTKKDEQVATDLNLGELPTEDVRGMKEVDPLENMITYNAGKAGFDIGQVLAGKYLGTKRVYSKKFTAPKRDEEGREYRDLHTFLNTKHNVRFGIWSVGTLAMVLSRVLKGEVIRITYLGRAEKPLKAGQSAPHTFKFEGRDGLELGDIVPVDESVSNDEAQAEARV